MLAKQVSKDEGGRNLEDPMLQLVRVRGGSMEPTLSDGDHIVCVRAQAARPGFVYWLCHPRLGRIVKRVGADGRLHSDCAEGTDSGRLGGVEECHVLGRAVLAVRADGVRRLPARRPYSRRA